MTLFAAIAALTHQGRERSSNQDSIAVNGWVRNAPMETARTWRLALDKPLICAVADGIGGGPCGDVASRFAAMEITKARACATPQDARELLERINADLYEEMARAPEKRRMGTTIAGLWVSADRFMWFNVGDSRLYRVRDGYLQQISVDDKAGARSHVITQALGGADAFAPIEAHVGEDGLPVPSRWMLCSDGLTDMLDVAGMEARLTADDAQSCAALFAAAMDAGGKDNISIVLATIDEGAVDGARDAA